MEEEYKADVILPNGERRSLYSKKDPCHIHRNFRDITKPGAEIRGYEPLDSGLAVWQVRDDQGTRWIAQPFTVYHWDSEKRLLTLS